MVRKKSILAAMAQGLAGGGSRLGRVLLRTRSAVLNGIVAIPIVTVMMVVVTRLSVLSRFSARPTLTFFGWAGTALMVITVVAVMKKGKIRQEQKNWKYKCAS
jgi:archaellum biogenesis protein FlaJ (TadC family)